MTATVLTVASRVRWLGELGKTPVLSGCAGNELKRREVGNFPRRNVLMDRRARGVRVVRLHPTG